MNVTTELMTLLRAKFPEANDAELSRKMHVTRAAVSFWVNGRTMAPDAIHQACELLGIDSAPYILKSVAEGATSNSLKKRISKVIEQLSTAACVALLVCASMFSPTTHANAMQLETTALYIMRTYVTTCEVAWARTAPPCDVQHLGGDCIACQLCGTHPESPSD